MKRKLYTIALLWAAALFALSTTFVQNTYAGDGFFSNIKRFGNHTYVGPFDISNHSRKKAKEKLAGDFAELEGNIAVELINQDQTVELPEDVVDFDLDATLAQASSGQDNPLISQVSRDGLSTVLTQNFQTLAFSEADVNAIASGIEEQLRKGIMPQRIHLADYMTTIYTQTQTIASSVYSMKELSKGIQLLMNSLDGTEIQPNQTFSFLEFVKEHDLAAVSDNELTIMASVLYEAALQTNWIIDERNISSELTAGVQPGFEAAINQALGLDFIFSNPNQTKFKLHFNWTNPQLQLTIEGLPFIYDYKPIAEKPIKYAPKTVIRYSAFVTPGVKETMSAGKDGLEVVVNRQVSLNGALQELEAVSSDFYPPQPRVERHHLIQNETATDGEGATPVETGTNSSTGGSATDTDKDDSSATGTSGSDGTGNGSSNGKPSGNGTSGGKTDGKVIYDKGGNIMKFDKGGNPID